MNGHERPKKVWESPWFWGAGGCCLGCIVLPLAFVALFGVAAGAVFMAGGDVFDAALVAMRTSPEAVEALGEPIEKGFLIQGSFSVDNDEGTADMSFPVSGPSGAGRLYVDGHKRQGIWEFDEVVLVMDDGRRIAVLE